MAELAGRVMMMTCDVSKREELEGHTSRLTKEQWTIE
jgi:hypothetical protein